MNFLYIFIFYKMTWPDFLTFHHLQRKEKKRKIYIKKPDLLGSPKIEGKKSYQRSGLFYSDEGNF